MTHRNRFAVGTTTNGSQLLFEGGKPVFNLTEGAQFMEVARPETTEMRPATIVEINRWRRCVAPQSFLDIGRPSLR